MIGRFASGLGGRPHAPIVAGLILLGLGLWFGSVPWRAAYPDTAALEAVEGTAIDAIELRKRRGALLRFLTGDRLELQVAIDPGGRIATYRSELPRYELLKEAIGRGPATYYVWPGAPDEAERALIWQFENADGRLIALADTVAALEAARTSDALLPAAIALVGLGLAGHGIRRWRPAAT